MSVFNKVVNKLDKLEDDNIKEKVVVDDTVNMLQAKADRLLQEAEVAATTAIKIREFYKID
jgi:hypothetical protein